jgi:MFS family permease
MNTDTKKIINQYYVYSALLGTWFASGIWIFFTRKFVTDTTVGFIDSLGFAVALLAEIPSGALADRIGRRKTVILGVLIYGIGYSMWGLSTSALMMAISFTIYWVGGAFISGADEAMMFEFLKSSGHENLWQKVSVNRFIITRVSLILSIFFGGYMYNYYDRLPFLARGLTFFLMLVPLYWLRVVDKYQPKQHKNHNFIRDLKTGVKELLLPNIVWVLPIYLMVQGVGFTIFTSGLLRPILFASSGVKINHVSSYVALTTLISVVFLFSLSRYAKSHFFRIRNIYLLGCLMALGFALNLPSSAIISISGLALVTVAAYSLNPILSNYINTTISSKYRATTLSAASFCENSLYVILAPLMGYLSTKGSIDMIIYICVGMIVFGLFTSAYLKLRKPVTAN